MSRVSGRPQHRPDTGPARGCRSAESTWPSARLEGAVENLESQEEGNPVDQLAITSAFCESPSGVVEVTEDKPREVVEVDFGVVTKPLDLESLINALVKVNTPEQFRDAVAGCSVEVVEGAIALSDTAPVRAQLRQWWEQLTELSPSKKPSILPADASTELVGWSQKLAQSHQALAQLSQVVESRGEELAHQNQTTESDVSERPPLTAYREGDEVWAYFPQAEQKWLKAVVQKVCVGFLRVKSGFFGMLIERDDMIAPGHWGFA